MSYNRPGPVGRVVVPFVLAACAGTVLAPAAAAQVWTSRANGTFSDPANWAGGQVPVSSPSTELTFTNRGHASYRAFNDLGVLTLGGITLHSRTGTATFIGQNPGSALEFADSSFIRTTDVGLFRFGGVTGVVNDWQLAGNLTLEAQSYGSTYIATPVSGPGSLTVASIGPSEIDGLFRLEGANSFAGGVFLNSGVLEISNALALGTGAVTANGGILRSTTSLTVSNDITANEDLLLRTTSGGLTLAGVISGPGGIDLRSVGSIQNTVTLTADNAYSGPTVIDMPVAYGVPSGLVGIKAGGITLSGGGAALNSSSYDVRNGGVLEVNYTTNPGLNRLGDTAPLNLDSARLNAIGNNTASSNTIERVGPIDVRGMGVFFINGRSGGMEVTSDSIMRSGRATAVVTLGNALSHLSLDAGPAMTGGIVPWIAAVPLLITSPRDLATFDAGRLRPLTAGEYQTTLTAGAGANVKLPAGSSGALNWVENNDNVTVNALVVPDFTGISGTGTINIAGGALIAAFGSETSIDNNIDFGPAEGIIHAGSISTINGVISGTNGVTKSGDFSLTTTAAHTYTGTTTINAGGFRFLHPDTFGTTSDFVNRTAGGGELVPSLEYRGAGTAVIDKPADAQSGAFRLAATTAGGNALEYAGVISGPGAVYLESATTNTGRLILSNDNTYTGGTRIFNAEVELNRDSNLGDPSGILEFLGTAGAGLVLTGNWNTSRPIRVLRATTIDSSGFDMSWSGRVDSGSNLTKIGQGTWRITPDGIANGDAAGWAVGSATSNSSVSGGRVELDGEFRMNWSVWDGTLAVNGSTRILNTFSLGGGQAVLAPGDIGGPGVGVTEAWSSSYAPGTRIVFDLGEQSDLITLVTTLSRGSGMGTVLFDFRVGPGIAEETYTLVEYFSNPTNQNNIFLPSDFEFVADVPGFDGSFDLIVRPDGTHALTFTVTAIPGPTCPADWNQDEVVNSGDISAFLSDWLADVQNGTTLADFNDDGVTNSNDISTFLTAWLGAVGGGC